MLSLSSSLHGDTRPASVQQLERTCAQLQGIVDEQEKAIRAMERAIKEAVTKQHVEILLSGKVTQVELQNLFQTLTRDLEFLLNQKADSSQLESMLSGKASLATIERLRREMDHLRDAITEGDGLDALTNKLGNPLEKYQQQMMSMLQAFKEEQKRQKEEELRRAAEAAAAASAGGKDKDGKQGGDGEDSPIRTGQYDENGNEILLNADGSPWTGRRMNPAFFSQLEKKELKDKIHRMELAIQFANAQQAALGGKSGGANAAGGNASGDGSAAPGTSGSAADEKERFEKALEARTGQMRSQIDALESKCDQAEREIASMRRMMENRMRHGGGLGGYGSPSGGLAGEGGLTPGEMQQLLKELAQLRDIVYSGEFPGGHGSGAHGRAGSLSKREEELLNEIAALTGQIRNMERMMSKQSHLHDLVQQRMQGLSSQLGTNFADLFNKVVALRMKVQKESQSAAAQLVETIHLQQENYEELYAWKQNMEGLFQDFIHGLGLNRALLGELSQPLHDQISTITTSQIQVHEAELEGRFEAEYGKLREKYDSLAEERYHSKQQALQEKRARKQRWLMMTGGVGAQVRDDEKDSSSSGMTSGRNSGTGIPHGAGVGNTNNQWDLYVDVREAFSPTPDPSMPPSAFPSRPQTSQGSRSVYSAAGSPTNQQLQQQQQQQQQQHQQQMYQGMAFTPSPPVGSAIGFLQPLLPERPSTSPLKSTKSTRRGSWQTFQQQQQQQSPTQSPTTSVRTTSCRPSSSFSGYVPSPDSAFQRSSPGMGPRWMPATVATSRGGVKTTNQEKMRRETSPERDENGHLLFRQRSPSTSPTRSSSATPQPGGSSSSRFNLKTASKSRPISGYGPSSSQASRKTQSRPGSSNGLGSVSARARSSALSVEHNDVDFSLELLRQRLTIPAYETQAAIVNYAREQVAAQSHTPASVVASSSSPPLAPSTTTTTTTTMSPPELSFLSTPHPASLEQVQPPLVVMRSTPATPFALSSTNNNSNAESAKLYAAYTANSARGMSGGSKSSRMSTTVGSMMRR